MKAKGIEKTVTWLRPELVDKLTCDNLQPHTPVVVIQDDRVEHIVGDVKVFKQKLSQPEFSNIYEIINNPDSIYYDLTKKTLMD